MYIPVEARALGEGRVDFREEGCREQGGDDGAGNMIKESR